MRDFSGLEAIADRGLEKAAAEAMGRLTTGNALVDMGAGFVPGVGTAMNAYNTVRNGVNGVNDLIHGRFKSSLGNFGSMAFNGAITALDAMSLGVGGRTIAGAAKLLGRGTKALGRGAQALRMGRTAKAMGNATRGIGRFADRARGVDARIAGAIANRLGGASSRALATTRVLNPRAGTLTNAGTGFGGWLVRHPYMSEFALGQMSTPFANMTEGAAGNLADIDRGAAHAGAGAISDAVRQAAPYRRYISSTGRPY